MVLTTGSRKKYWIDGENWVQECDCLVLICTYSREHRTGHIDNFWWTHVNQKGDLTSQGWGSRKNQTINHTRNPKPYQGTKTAFGSWIYGIYGRQGVISIITKKYEKKKFFLINKYKKIYLI